MAVEVTAAERAPVEGQGELFTAPPVPAPRPPRDVDDHRPAPRPRRARSSTGTPARGRR